MNAIRLGFGALLLLFAAQGFSQEAKRVVSLAPSLTSIIYEIKGEDRLVGCTSYCTSAVTDRVEQVGSTVDANIEKILALEPDLVLTMQLTKPQDIAAMQKLGIRVELINTPRNFDEICEQTLFIAGLIGKEEQAKQLIANTRKRVEDIRKKAAKIESRKVFFQIGANPVFTVLQNTFMDDLITFCNAENIANGLTRGTITREAVLLRKPDVIIIATMGGFGEQELEAWKSYRGIPAVDKQRIFLIDSNTSCLPTPLAFASALEDVYRFTKD